MLIGEQHKQLALQNDFINRIRFYLIYQFKNIFQFRKR